MKPLCRTQDKNQPNSALPRSPAWTLNAPKNPDEGPKGATMRLMYQWCWILTKRKRCLVRCLGASICHISSFFLATTSLTSNQISIAWSGALVSWLPLVPMWQETFAPLSCARCTRACWLIRGESCGIVVWWCPYPCVALSSTGLYQLCQ